MTINDTFGLVALTTELTLDEKRVAIPYFDTRHHLTGGIGRNLGRGFSDAEIDFLFANDVADCCRSLDAHVPWWRTLPPTKQRVMINLCFNMGWTQFAQFKRFLGAMQGQDWQEAADELKDSLWFGEVHDRGPRVIARLLGTVDGAPIA